MMFKDGIKVKELIAHLQKLPQDKLFFVSSDEEQNQIFKGVFIEHYDDCVLIAGLSGCEAEE